MDSLAEVQELKEKESKKLRFKIEERIEASINTKDLLRYLESEMYRAAQDLRFEDAAYLRDQIKDLKLNKNIK